jgi:hypothetical protein
LAAAETDYLLAKSAASNDNPEMRRLYEAAHKKLSMTGASATMKFVADSLRTAALNLCFVDVRYRAA